MAPETFNLLFTEALFSCDVLGKGGRGEWDRIRPWSDTYYDHWQAYFVHRTLSRTTEPTGAALLINETAADYCEAAGITDPDCLLECIWALCDVRNHDDDRSFFETDLSNDTSPEGRRGRLLIAAICMNNEAIALECVPHVVRRDAPHCTTACLWPHRSRLFACPAYVAARLSRLEILRELMRDTPCSITTCTMAAIGDGGTFGTLGFIILAAGNLAELSSRPHTIIWHAVNHAMRTSDPKIWDLAHHLVHWWGGEYHLEAKGWLRQCCRVADGIEQHAVKGNVEVLRHMFDKGVPANKPIICQWRSGHEHPRGFLTQAARHHRVEVVKLYLERCADLSNESHNGVLFDAAAAGSFDIVKLLVDYGADVLHCRYNDRFPVVGAIWVEHVAMFHYLREKGGLTRESWKAALETATEQGLDSMVDLLNDWQVEAPDSINLLQMSE